MFIEFESTFDADWLGVWHSLLKQAPDLEIHRQKIPSGPCTSLGMILKDCLFVFHFRKRMVNGITVTLSAGFTWSLAVDLEV